MDDLPITVNPPLLGAAVFFVTALGVFTLSLIAVKSGSVDALLDAVSSSRFSPLLWLLSALFWWSPWRPWQRVRVDQHSVNGVAAAAAAASPVSQQQQRPPEMLPSSSLPLPLSPVAPPAAAAASPPPPAPASVSSLASSASAPSLVQSARSERSVRLRRSPERYSPMRIG